MTLQPCVCTKLRVAVFALRSTLGSLHAAVDSTLHRWTHAVIERKYCTALAETAGVRSASCRTRAANGTRWGRSEQQPIIERPCAPAGPCPG